MNSLKKICYNHAETEYIVHRYSYYIYHYVPNEIIYRNCCNGIFRLLGVTGALDIV
jgi:hypothetical protein